MMDADPPRWSSDSSDSPEALRRMLHDARQVGPTRDEAARVFARLESGGGVASAAGVGLAASVAAAIALVVTGVWTLRNAPHEDTAALEAMPQASGYSAPAPSEPKVPPVSVSTENEAPAAPAAGPTAGATKQGVPAARPGVAPAERTTRGAPSAKPSEAALLHAARAELLVKPERAVEFLRVHRDIYPKGLLSEERDALLVEALARAGDARAAEKERRAFQGAHPDSALLPRE